MKIAAARDMAAVDRAAAERCGIPVAALMEEAGRRVAEAAAELLGGAAGRTVFLVCGRGNNGGDGFVAARLLHEAGADTLAVLADDPASLRPDARAAWEGARRAGVACASCPDAAALDALAGRARAADLVVDALLGTGFVPPARGIVLAAIRFINGLDRPVLAVDLPSGLAADDGHVAGEAVRATATVTFGYPKRGLVEFPAAALTGRLWCADIGFPRETDDLVAGDLNLLTPADLAPHLAPRDPQAHKGSCGHVLVLAGSRGMVGAAALAARGALRGGAGLVTVALPASVAPPLLPSLPEAMLLPLPDGGTGVAGPAAADALRERLAAANVLVAGPGLSRTAESAALVREMARTAAVPLVLDADALHGLADNPAMQPAWRCGPAVLTPHPGEAARLLGTDATAVQADRVAAARRCAAHFGAAVVLKGARTVIAEPGGTAWINPTGNPAMAAPGMGDVLAGLIGAHL
ncbi:MAG TPA: NAD(P)H-hydrate dehydratase, partial [Candidatus Methanoperedens sp.]|nr:NAD(P)H-hydrate dehydratase [Candidatus Methanoperedens sp.]